MTSKKALQILREMQAWRRSNILYDGDSPQTMPYTLEQFGEAIDYCIATLDTMQYCQTWVPLSVGTIQRIIHLHTQWRYNEKFNIEHEEEYIRQRYFE